MTSTDMGRHGPGKHGPGKPAARAAGLPAASLSWTGHSGSWPPSGLTTAPCR